MWVGRALQGHVKATMVSALSVNLGPNIALADAVTAASTVDRIALQRSCSLATLHLAWMETIGMMQIHPADSTMDMSSSSH